MSETTFYRFEPVTKEEMEEVYSRDTVAFVIKEDTDEEIQQFVNWISTLTPFEDHMATYIIVTGEILNKYYSEYWEYEMPYPNDITFLAFYLDEMEDPDTVIGELGYINHFDLDLLIEGLFIESAIKEQERLKRITRKIEIISESIDERMTYVSEKVLPENGGTLVRIYATKSKLNQVFDMMKVLGVTYEIV